VDTQVAREVLDPAGQVQYVVGNLAGGLLFRRGDAAPAVDELAVGVLLPRAVTERLRRVPDRGRGPVGDDVGDLRGVEPAVFFVDVLDGFFAAVGLDVDVDVRRPVPLRRQEPLEQQVPLHRVGVADAQGVADRGVRRGSAALAQD
jgi:hypothetical protein